MKTILVIFLKEVVSFLLSPLAWILMGLFTFLNAWLFISVINAMMIKETSHSLVYNVFNSGWFWMGFLILFPIITMKLFSEEKKMGTLESLLTAPVSGAQIIIAKYIATIIVYCVIMTPLFLFFPLFKLIYQDSNSFYSGELFGTILCLFLIGMLNIAIGMLSSSLTTSQVVSSMSSFVFVMLHYFLGYVGKFGLIKNSQWSDLISYFSMFDHIQDLSQGVIRSGVIIYYVSFSILLLAVINYVLESRKLRI